MSEPVRLLFVCTGNLGRSVMGERLARRGLADRLGDDARAVEVTSAGTWGIDGQAMDEHAGTVIQEYGADADGFAARELRAAHITAADLVLTASREHRAVVVAMEPRATQRTFTVRELARLLGALPDAPRAAFPALSGPDRADSMRRRLAEVVAAALATRGQQPPSPPEDDDVPDPHGRSLQVFRASGALIAGALVPVLDVITGVRGGPGHRGERAVE